MHHHSHPDIINRLKRANGHLNKIIAMIEEGKPCLEVAQQLQAVYAAIGSAKQVFVHDHIEGCIEHGDTDTPADAKQKMRELKEITKYL
jgi:DNA-binding FrmR family transcriptional regulator